MGMSKYYWVYPWDWGLLDISRWVFHDGDVLILLSISVGSSGYTATALTRGILIGQKNIKYKNGRHGCHERPDSITNFHESSKLNLHTADFIKKVLSVYTHSMTTIYLSLSAQVAKSTFFMKSPVYYYSLNKD